MAVTPLTPAQQAAVDALADAYRRSAVDLETLAPMLDTSARRHRTSDGGELLERLLETKSLDPVSQLIGLLGIPGIGDAAWRRLEKRGSGPAEEVRKVLVKQGRTER